MQEFIQDKVLTCPICDKKLSNVHSVEHLPVNQQIFSQIMKDSDFINQQESDDSIEENLENDLVIQCELHQQVRKILCLTHKQVICFSCLSKHQSCNLLNLETLKEIKVNQHPQEMKSQKRN